MSHSLALEGVVTTHTHTPLGGGPPISDAVCLHYFVIFPFSLVSFTERESASMQQSLFFSFHYHFIKICIRLVSTAPLSSAAPSDFKRAHHRTLLLTGAYSQIKGNMAFTQTIQPHRSAQLGREELSEETPPKKFKMGMAWAKQNNVLRGAEG